MTGDMWTIHFQCKGRPEEDEFISADMDRAQISYFNLVHFKEQLGYGARDFLYYKKRCGGDVARLAHRIFTPRRNNTTGQCGG